jgi:hypothetical protein
MKTAATKHESSGGGANEDAAEGDLIFSGRRLVPIALATAVLGAVGTVIGFLVDRRDTYFAYLAAFVFVTSLALGGLLQLMIYYAVGAKWNVALRRLNESMVSVFPLLALLFVPIAFGLGDLYLWMDPSPAWPEKELATLHHRQQYLNSPFFLARAAVYFAIWLVCAYLLRRWSLRKDRGVSTHSLLSLVADPAGAAPAPASSPERAFSAALLPPVCLALTFASFDWLMSLEPLWGSSLFGVYYFAGGFVASLGLLSVLGHYARQGRAQAAIRPPHFHALGRMMLGFTIFWGYCAFFQAMLVQIANKPEEVRYYVARSTGGFGWLSLALGLSRFALPFFVLLPRGPKFRSGLMAVVGAWLVLGQYLDVLWLILPEQGERGALAGLWYLSALLALGGASVAFAALRLRGRAIVPVGDPALAQSIAYRSPT